MYIYGQTLMICLPHPYSLGDFIYMTKAEPEDYRFWFFARASTNRSHHHSFPSSPLNLAMVVLIWSKAALPGASGTLRIFWNFSHCNTIQTTDSRSTRTRNLERDLRLKDNGQNGSKASSNPVSTHDRCHLGWSQVPRLFTLQRKNVQLQLNF
jgi:hypothetical protein